MVQVTVLFHTFPPLMIFFGQTEAAVRCQYWVTKAAGATTWCLGDTRYVGGWRELSYTPAHFKKKNEVTVSKKAKFFTVYGKIYFRRYQQNILNDLLWCLLLNY